MDERANERVAVDFKAGSKLGEATFSAVIKNLSIAGCMVDAGDHGLLQAGSSIQIQFPHVGIVSGVIVWVRSGYCGIQFEEPLHEAIVRQLGFRPLPAKAEFFRDQFGRPAKQPRRPLA